ncbi:cytochrome bd oxidase small subunit CydS [Allobacillus halotolerans]
MEELLIIYAPPVVLIGSIILAFWVVLRESPSLYEDE